MANLNFKSDLILGNEGEQIVIEFLKSKGSEFIKSNNDNKYDIMMNRNGKTITYEIKTDVKCAPLFDTGNLFVKFESRGKDSGIKTSQSDWFVTYFKYFNELWFIKTKTLKELINDNEFTVFKNAGDIGSATHGYLINRKKYTNHFHVHKIL